AVTQAWSNGPVEGHVNRLKTIKRQMYGRAGFVLLRARVLNVACQRGAVTTLPGLARPTSSKVILLANSLGAPEAADYRPPGEPILPNLRLTPGGREFASSIKSAGEPIEL